MTAGSRGTHIRLLCPIEVSLDGDALPLGTRKQRALLAVLALAPNTAVAVDELVERLWGDEPPSSAPKMVQLYVSHLRRVLDGNGVDTARIVTHGRGYELRLDADRVDAARFERLVEEASGDAGGHVRDALALWRGPPLADVADEPFAAAEIRRLEELRLMALELAIDADLAAGRHREALGELDALVTEHPLRERLHGLRMLALYRAGRQAEALEAYRQARALLVGEIGVEPGPELRRLHDDLLRQDPALEHVAAAAPAPGLRIRLLGAFGLSFEGRPIETIDAPRLQALLTYLVLHRDTPQPRERLASLFWPDSEEAQSRTNLRQALHLLRRALPEHDRYLQSETRTVRWRDDAPLSSDLTELDELLARAADARQTSRTADERQALEAAIAVYGDGLLPSCEDEWILPERDRLREAFLRAVERLADLLEAEREYRAAIPWARRLVDHDAVNEGACRRLMRLYALSDDRAGALRAYQDCADALARELGVEPSAETRTAYERLLAPDTAASDRAHPSRRQHNLPAETSSFVGRARELEEIARLLGRTRLLTLTGAGGAGKTRLAREVTGRHLGEYEDGAWFVELAAVSDDELVAQEVASVLGLELPHRGPALPALAAQLRDRRALIVLDNCEHLIEGCCRLTAELLRSCPRLIVLATSREALRLEGEVAWPVPSLAVPDPFRLPVPEEIAQLESVRLFCERASAVAPDFAIDEHNAAGVAELCLRLDGMPLALELAAARVAVLSPQQILARLRDTIDVLGRGSRGADDRQRTLTATLDWSHDLLTGDEQVLFRRVAVFTGSFGIEAAEGVCGIAPLTAADVLDLLGRLVDKSLLTVERHRETARYRLLGTIRQYGRERLSASGEEDALTRRHREWYTSFAEAHDPEQTGRLADEVARRLDAEHDNLRGALASAIADAPEEALRLTTSLWRFWVARGHFAEGRRWLEAALTWADAPDVLRTRALFALAVFDMRRGVPGRRLQLADEIVAIHRKRGDELALAEALHLAALLPATADHFEDVARLALESQELADRLGAKHISAAATHLLGWLAQERGEPAAALRRFAQTRLLLEPLGAMGRGFFPAITPGLALDWDGPDAPRMTLEETVVLGHRLDASHAHALVLGSEAWAARATGDLDLALACATESAERFEALGWSDGTAIALAQLGNLHRVRGELGPAREHLERSLKLRRELRDPRATGLTLGGLGMVAAAEHDPERADVLLREALALFERIEDGFAIAGTLLNMGVAALRVGDLAAAGEALARSWARGVAPGKQRPRGWTAVMLAEIARAEGDDTTADARLHEAREILAALGERAGIRHCDRMLRGAPAANVDGTV